MRTVCLTLLLSILLSGCSSRVEYDRSAPAIDAGSININTATADQLDKLPTIGRKTAEAIIEFRQQNGPFRRVEHLLLVRGVSENRFSKIRPLIRTE
jgi:competence protein ComEA